MSGKGDKPRRVDGERYRANYERIFGETHMATDRLWLTCKYCDDEFDGVDPSGPDGYKRLLAKDFGGWYLFHASRLAAFIHEHSSCGYQPFELEYETPEDNA